MRHPLTLIDHLLSDITAAFPALSNEDHEYILGLWFEFMSSDDYDPTDYPGNLVIFPSWFEATQMEPTP
jgi:hypothetical protein